MQKLDIKLQPSQQFKWFLILLTLSSILIIWFLSISIMLKLCLSFLSLAYGIYHYFRYGLLQHPHSIVGLKLARKEWSVLDHAGYQSAILCGSSTITRRICILRFKVSGKKLKQSCILFRDSVQADQYRKIRLAVFNKV